MNTLFTAIGTNLVVKEEIELSETVIQEQRLETELKKRTGDANVTSGGGRTDGAEQSFAQNDEAEVRKLAMSFQCPKCPKRFGNRKLAQHHLRKLHSSTQMRPQYCLICSRTFKYKSFFSIHMNHHHEKVCPICNVVVSGTEILKYHVESLHIGKVEYVCPMCFKMSIDSASHEDHVSSHNGRRRYECEDCSKYYASPEGLGRHRLTHVRVIKNKLRTHYKCTICSKAYRWERNLRVHMNTHTGRRLFKCDQCPEKFLNRQYLQAHRKTHVSLPSKITERKYKCSYCLKSYSRRQSLKNHINTHTGARPFKCDECPKNYASSKALLVHRQSHLPGSSQVKCSVCSKVFKNSRNLRIHMNIHSGSRPYKCDQCSGSFTNPSGLTRHRQVHLNKLNRLKCSICSKTLSTLRNLRLHMNIHTGMRPYQCDQCPNNYRNASCMARHRQSHSQRDKFEYKCDVCSAIFTNQRSLNIHSNRYHDASFKCRQCGKAYSNGHLLSRHYRDNPSHSELKCSICCKGFFFERSLNYHMTTHLEVPLYKCDECPKEFYTPSGLLRHRRIHLKGSIKLHKCQVCGGVYGTRGQLARHYSDNPSHDSSEFKCSICSKGFVSEQSLNNHIRKHLQAPLHKCNERPEKFYSPSDLLRHHRVHLKSEKNLHKCAVCHEILTTREHLAAHRDTHAGPRPYKCNQCPKDYASRNAFQLSFAQNDEAEVRKLAMSFQCPKCPKRFGNRKLAQHHLRKLHSSTQMRPQYCLICSRTFKYKSFFSIHMNHHHEKVCPICNVVVSGSEILKYHVESLHIGKVEYVCPMCFKMSIDSASHEDHVSSHNGRRRYECEVCSKYYASPEGLGRHRLTHVRVIKNKLRTHYKCTICSKAYRWERNLRVHMNTHTGRRLFKCDQCPEKFLNRQYLQAHRKTHVSLPSKITERKYKCSYCLKSYSHRQSLKNHINTHTGARPFKCDECPKNYASSKALLVHRQSHLPGSSQVKCSVCSKVFKNSRNLRIHMNIHSGSRPYKCDQCSGSFTNPSGLTRHRQVHLNKLNRLKCSICSKTLSTLRNLRFHMNIHTGMRPYQCDQCPNNYRNASCMARHRQSHSQRDKFEYKCDVCSAIFTNQRSLNIHSNRYHDASFKCRQCGKAYSNGHLLSRHYRDNPSHSELKCSICCKGFFFERSLNYHMTTHLEVPLYKCDECPKEFYTPSGLLRHRRIHLKGSIKLHKCQVCGGVYGTRGQLARHYSDNPSHDSSEFKCSICSKGFVSEQSLKYHIRKHLQAPLHKCNECPKKFYSPSDLLRHHRVHLKSEKNLPKFAVCHEILTTREHLAAHRDTHAGPRPYKCNQCPKDYASRNALSGHLRTHLITSGECNSLQYEGKDGELDKVADLHTALLKFKCKKCDKEFISERNLSFHSRQHEKELTP